jgi:hypothetical protein
MVITNGKKSISKEKKKNIQSTCLSMPQVDREFLNAATCKWTSAHCDFIYFCPKNYIKVHCLKCIFAT